MITDTLTQIRDHIAQRIKVILLHGQGFNIFVIHFKSVSPTSRLWTVLKAVYYTLIEVGPKVETNFNAIHMPSEVGKKKKLVQDWLQGHYATL